MIDCHAENTVTLTITVPERTAQAVRALSMAMTTSVDDIVARSVNLWHSEDTRETERNLLCLTAHAVRYCSESRLHEVLQHLGDFYSRCADSPFAREMLELAAELHP